MEFLLQLFADLLGSPVEEEEVARQKIRKDEVEPQNEIVQQVEEISEEQILFDLMQFH